MSADEPTPSSADPSPLELVPRMTAQGYEPEQVDRRRDWIEEKTGTQLHHVGSFSVPSEETRGNIENPIGAAQIPLGVAGPLLVKGLHADGTFYVPLATTEGALVRSYERGMVTLTRAGGVETRLYMDENRMAPVFFFDDIGQAWEFAREVPRHFEDVRAATEATTQHGKLLRLECHPLGRQVMVDFCYSTGDAQGMNMIARATEQGCRWLVENSIARRYHLFSGMSSEKRASGLLLVGGKGKKVTAGALVPAQIAKAYLHATPEMLFDVWQHTLLGHLQANAIGYNAHVANGLTAIFIACGQDVANVANAAVAITNFELTQTGDLYASVTLPSLTVATVGGGTGQGTARECLQMLDCAGGGKSPKFAEIVAAALLAGELSMAAAIASGEFVAAHETYGRNRPGG